PRWPKAVWLGLFLLLTSFASAGWLLRTRAQDNPAPGGAARPDRRAVAIAYVDVEGGVRSLYPVRPGRVVEVLAEEGKEYEQGKPLFRVDDALAKRQLEEAEIDLQASKKKVAEAKRLVEQHKKKVEAQKAAVDVLRKDVDVAKAQKNKAQRVYGERLGGTAEDV